MINQTSIYGRHVRPCLAVLVTVLGMCWQMSAAHAAQEHLTPRDREIQKQQQRLLSTDAEERRDAVIRLGLLHHPAASKVASSVLNDSVVAVRVAAMTSLLSLPPDESAALLIPLLQEKNEFIRQEACYALGRTSSPTAVQPLIDLLAIEKKSGVRAAAVVALGELHDQSAVVPLSQILAPDSTAESRKKKSSTGEQNEFVLRAAAHSLGQLRNRAAVPALVATLQNDQNPSDLRREAAVALGLIGDPQVVSLLRAVLTESDPYLSSAAQHSLKQIADHQQVNP